jgi:hypothetical protein
MTGDQSFQKESMHQFCMQVQEMKDMSTRVTGGGPLWAVFSGQLHYF